MAALSLLRRAVPAWSVVGGAPSAPSFAVKSHYCKVPASEVQLDENHTQSRETRQTGRRVA